MNILETLKNIYENNIDKYKIGPTKFGICMATYQRKNGKSSLYLKEILTSIIQQTATNWHLYLVGDKYENENEIINILNSFPKEKLTFINLTYAQERDNLTDLEKLWCVGGSNATNYSYKLAVYDGCDYIIHTDDDDPMHNKKIQILNYILTIYSPICMFHYSTYLGPNTILPKKKITEIKENNYIPIESNVIHSSLCIHKSIASTFSYDGYREDKIIYSPNDMQLIEFIRNSLKNKENYTIFIPLLLCTHNIEKEIIPIKQKKIKKYYFFKR
jgi:hypothetical protein